MFNSIFTYFAVGVVLLLVMLLCGSLYYKQKKLTVATCVYLLMCLILVLILQADYDDGFGDGPYLFNTGIADDTLINLMAIGLPVLVIIALNLLLKTKLGFVFKLLLVLLKIICYLVVLFLLWIIIQGLNGRIVF